MYRRYLMMHFIKAEVFVCTSFEQGILRLDLFLFSNHDWRCVSNNSGNNCHCQRVGTTCKLSRGGGGDHISEDEQGWVWSYELGYVFYAKGL